MIETVLLVAVRDNQGRRFSPRLWDQLELRLAAFGGFTRAGDVVGQWASQGRTYADRSREYRVALTSWWQLADWLAVVDWARDAFRQEALYIKVAGIPEIR